MDHEAHGDSPLSNALRESVRRRRISCIYHYTAAKHLESIFRHGAILCRRELNAREITYQGHGWGYLGKEDEMQDYIICSFAPHWGMIRRQMEPAVVIELNPNLIWRAGTIFCAGNSASNEYNVTELEVTDPVTTFDNLFPDERGNWPTSYQAEVLVRNSIEIEYFTRLLFSHADHMEFFKGQVEAGWRANPNRRLSHRIGVVVDPTKFPPGFNPPFNRGEES